MLVTTKVKLKIDNKQWKAMSRRLLAGTPKAVNVGWWSDRYPDGVPVAQVAAWNEEGHVNGGMFAGTITPARPFIRTGFLPYVKKIVPTYYGDVHRIAMGNSTWGKLNSTLGAQLVRIMQDTIHRWKIPPNSPTTVSLKGFNDPLVETGYMMQSVKYRIVAKGAK